MVMIFRLLQMRLKGCISNHNFCAAIHHTIFGGSFLEMESEKVFVVIFAGGVGARMKCEETPKQFLKIDGKPIIISTLEYFSSNKNIEEIVVVCLETWMETLQEYIDQYAIQKVAKILPGGNTGFQSIHIGLNEVKTRTVDDDIVLLCDGVRPILSQNLIDECIEQTRKYGTAVPVTPSIDSVMFSEDGTTCKKRFDRKKIYITQAPQGYKKRIIMEAHEEAIKKGIESVSSADLLIELGKEVHLFEGIRENIKVTTKQDLYTLRSTTYYEHFLNFAKEEFND